VPRFIVELSNPLVLILLTFVALAVFGWVLLSRVQSAVRQKPKDQFLLLIQGQIDSRRLPTAGAEENIRLKIL
jgi:hypothetical protein